MNAVTAEGNIQEKDLSLETATLLYIPPSFYTRGEFW